MQVFYRGQDGLPYAYDSEAERDQFGPAGLVRMTAEEEESYRNPLPTYSQALAALNAAYQLKIDGFNRQFALAALADGPSEEGKKLSIRSDYEAAKLQHAANIAQLKNQYGIGV